MNYQTVENLTPAFFEAEKNISRTRTRDEDEEDFNDLAGESGSGSSAPGALRASNHQENAVSTSDAAGDATQAGQSPNQTGAAQDASGPCGRGAAGDPPTACVSTPMNHPAVTLSNAEGGLRSAESKLSERQLLEANARRLMLLAAVPFLENGLSVAKTAAACGVNGVKLHRVLMSAPTRGAERITSLEKCRRLLALPVEKLAPDVSAGQGSAFAALLQVPGIVAEMHRLYSATMGASCAQATNDRRTGSISTTLMRLGDFHLVPPHLGAKLRAGAKPKCLVDVIKAAWTPEMEAKFRGQKHYATATIAGRRELTEELADGSRVPLQPGRVWVFDDMSSNIPFWFDCDSEAGVATGELGKLISRHGCALGRQGLYAWDWASGAWLGLELVGRLRDAYQASDILRFIRKLVMIYGKPDKIIMERGTWQSRAISGWVVADGQLKEIGDSVLVPEMAADEQAMINDGIRAIGVEIIHTFTPRGKPIEGAFNHHQRLVPTFLKPGEAVNIGRHAGEFEWSAKAKRQADDGVQHPRDLGFIHIDRLADVAWEAMQWEGNNKKAGRDGKPLEILTTWLNTSPLPPATERDLAVFLPDKRNSLIRDGVLTAQVNGDTHQFLNPEIFAALGDGVRVDWAFDPAEPTLGAAVYNAKGFLCWASYLPAGPVISALDRAADPAVQLLKRYKLAHRTAARMLDLKTLRTVRTAERRDGAGQVATVSNADRGVRNVEKGNTPRVMRSVLAPQTAEEISRQHSRFERLAARSRELAELRE